MVASLLHAHAGHMEHTVEALLALADTTPLPQSAAITSAAVVSAPPYSRAQHAELRTWSGGAASAMATAAALGGERAAEGAGQTEEQVGTLAGMCCVGVRAVAHTSEPSFMLLLRCCGGARPFVKRR